MSDSAVAGAQPVTRPLAGVASVRAERLVPVLLTAAVLVVAIMTITPWPVGAFQDDAIYTVLAKSLASGQGFRMINLPDAPHATHYPPGYPLLLAALWKVSPAFPDNIVVFKFANAVFLAIAAFGTYHFARTRIGMSVALSACCALLGTLSIVVLLITGVVLSEPMFMAMLLPVLLLAERSAESGRMQEAIAAGLAMGALALVRTLGVVVIPAALAVFVLRGRWRAALALGASAALLLVPWQLWVSAYQSEIPRVLTGKYGSYGPWLSEGYRAGGFPFARAVLATNMQSLDQLLSYMFMPVTATWPRGIAFVGVSLLAVGGLVAIVRRAPVTAISLLFYAAIILLWPFEPNRFLLAVWPLLVILVVSAVMSIWQWRPGSVGRPLRLVALSLALYVSVGYAVYNVRGYRGQWWASVQRDVGRRAKPIAEWVARHTKPSDVLSTEDDLIVYLYTGRAAVPTSTFLAVERLRPLSSVEERDAVEALLTLYRPRYHIVASKVGIATADTLAAQSPPLLRRVSQTTNALIYERIDR